MIEINDTNHLYQDFIENASDLIQCVDTKGKFVYVNNIWLEKLGYSHDEANNLFIWDIIHPDSIMHCKKAFREVMQGENLGYIEATFISKNGDCIQVEGNVNCRFDSNGEIISTRAIFRDVTSHRRMEKQILENLLSLESSNKLQKAILDISECFVTISSINLITDINTALKKLGEALNISSVYIYRYKKEKNTFKYMYEWRDEIADYQDVDSSRQQILKEWVLRYNASQTINISDVNQIPRGSIMRDALEKDGIKSFLLLPLAKDDEVYGIIGFDSTKGIKEYKEYETQLLLQFGNMYMNTYTRMRAEEALIRSENKYKSLIENLNEIVYILNKRGDIVYISSNVYAISGYTAEELQGRNFIDLIFDVDKENMKKEFLKTLKGKLNPIEYRFTTKEEDIIWVRTNAKPIIENGEVVGVQGILTGITDLKKMEEELTQNKDFLNTILNSIQDGVAVINEDFSVEYMNPTAIKWNIEFAKDNKCYKILKNREKACEFCLKDNCLGTGLPQHQQKKIKTSEGEKWVEVFCYPFNEKGSSKRKVVEFMHDITTRKEIENSLFYEKEQFKTTLLSVGDGVIAVDINQKIVVMNKVAEYLTGYTQKEAEGKSFIDIFNIVNERTRGIYDNIVDNVLVTGKTIESLDNIMLVSKDGYERPIEKTASPIKDKNGEITGVVIVFRDFSEKKEKQREILYLSYHDQLTKLYNRRFFEEEITRIDKEENYPLTLVMLDVNGLKLVNDAFGHLVGDKLLQLVAEILIKHTRKSDIVARVGGDEFVIILPSIVEFELKNIIKNISDAISTKRLHGMNLSVSYGWETKVDTTIDIMDIFKKAEDHMYRRKLSESQSMRHSAVEVILKTLYEKSQREEKHSKRVSELCVYIGRAVGLSKVEINEMKTVGLMHDIGKIIIPDEVLNKPESLTSSEWITMKRHSETGYKILSSVNEFAPLAKEVLQHHERWDGTGYPKGLKGEEIEYKARIIAIADAYDAMTSDRPYRKGMSKEDAIAEIKRNAGKQFDPDIANIFINIIDSI